MSSSDAIGWGGLAAMLSGVAFIVLFIVGLVSTEPLPGSFFDFLGSILFVVALLLLLVGMVGFHTLQKGNYGRIGRAGLYTVIVSSSAQILAQVVLLSGSVALEFLDFLGLLGVMIGFVLYGAATLQARVLPRWCGVGFIVGLPLWVFLSVVLGGYGVIGEMLFGLLWVALGYVLWSQRSEAAEQISRVR